MLRPAEGLGSKLRTLRIRSGLSQTDLAKVLHTTQITLSQWELGKFRPGAKFLKRLNRVLGFPPFILSLARIFIHGKQSRGTPSNTKGKGKKHERKHSL